MARPCFNPTAEQRKMVQAMAAMGNLQADIARTIGDRGIDEKTLRKHFRHELDTAVIKANTAVAKSLYESATSGKCPAAAMFWLSRRGGPGWRETTSIEHSGPKGGPIEILERNRKRVADELARLAAARDARAVAPEAESPDDRRATVPMAGLDGKTGSTGSDG